jgi:hypothetical protein
VVGYEWVAAFVAGVRSSSWEWVYRGGIGWRYDMIRGIYHRI